MDTASAHRRCWRVFKWSSGTLLVGFVIGVVLTVWANGLSTYGLLIPTEGSSDYYLYTVVNALRVLTIFLIVPVWLVVIASGLGSLGLWLFRKIRGQRDDPTLHQN